MNRPLFRLVFCSILAFFIGCGGSSHSFQEPRNAGPGNPGQTATLNFRFVLQRGDGQVPREVELFEFIGVDSEGNLVVSDTRNKTTEVDLVVPISLRQLTLNFVGGGVTICQDLLVFDLEAGSSQTIVPDPPRVAPTGVRGLELSPQNAQVPVGTTTQFTARVRTANGSRDVTSDTLFQTSFAGLDLDPNNPGSGTGITPGPFTVTGLYRPPATNVFTAQGEGASIVRGFDAIESQQGLLTQFFPFNSGFQGGVRVATGDVNGDGVPDIITGAGPGGGPHVRVFDGRDGETVTSEFFAYTPSFVGGVFVASGDVSGDGVDDIITGAGSGGPAHVKVFDGSNNQQLGSFFAYGTNFTGGVRVATGDVNGDGHDDIITGPGAGGGPNVRVFDGRDLSARPPLLGSFFAYDNNFTGGVFVAAGDVNNDGVDDIITGAGPGAGPQVKVFDGASNDTLGDFFAYEPSFTGGVRVASADVNGDGVADIITGAGPGGGPHVKVFDGGAIENELADFFAYDAGFSGGVFVAGASNSNNIRRGTVDGRVVPNPDQPGNNDPVVFNGGEIPDFCHFITITECPQPLSSFSLMNTTANPMDLLIEGSMPVGAANPVFQFATSLNPNLSNRVQETLAPGQNLDVTVLFNCSTANSFTGEIRVFANQGATQAFTRVLPVEATIKPPLAGDPGLSVVLSEALGIPPRFQAGDVISLDRITNGLVTPADASCPETHLDGDNLMIDGQGPFPDPQPGGCNFGLIIETP